MTPTFRSEQSVSEPELAKMTSELDMNITTRKRKQPECDCTTQLSIIHADIKESLSEWNSGLNAKLSTITDDIKTIRSDMETYIMAIKKEMDSLRTDNISIKKEVIMLTEEVAEIKKSATYISNEYDDNQKRLNTLEESILSKDFHQGILKTLEAKIDNLEQQARQCNLEISNVPERRDENLFNLIEDIGKKINTAIPRDEIVTVHRVPHAAASERPKNIVAKFKTRALRDNVLSAFRLKRGVTSTDLGILGATRTVYVNEHLTLQKKQLLRETRDAARKWNYKFVWVKHSTILVKLSETSPTIAIKSSNDIKKLTINNTN